MLMSNKSLNYPLIMNLRDHILKNQKIKQQSTMGINKPIEHTTAASRIKIPEKLNIVFREDYDIRQVDQIIIEKIKREQSSQSLYETLIANEKIELSLSFLESERLYHSCRIAALTEDMNRICNPKRLHDYIERSRPLINEYIIIPKTTITFDINNNSNSTYYPTETDYRRINVIKEYFNLAIKYIEIHVTCTGELPSNINTLCLGCGRDLGDIVRSTIHVDYCPHCMHHCELTYTHAKIKRKDMDEGKPAASCNELGNFIKAINHYQGKIPLKGVNMKDIIEKLDGYFMDNGLPTSEQARNRPFNSKGQREGTDIDKLIRAMKDRKISHYSHANLIAKDVWGWKLPDISHLEETLINDYNATQAIRSTLSLQERGGKSNIPVRLRLCEHLKKRGWNCDYSDFKLSDEYQKYIPGFNIMCERSGIPELMQKN